MASRYFKSLSIPFYTVLLRAMTVIRNTYISGLFYFVLKAEQIYTFFRVKKIPTIAPIRIIGANLINSHSNA